MNKRVNDYFKDNNIKKTGNRSSYLKAVLMFTLHLAPFVLLLTVPMPHWLQLIFVIIIGIGMAGVGMNVAHESVHGAFSSREWVNKLMGYSMYLVARNVFVWEVQHNVLHHTFTNVKEHDEDIDAGIVIRFFQQI